MARWSAFNAFNNDAASNAGYQYTQGASASSIIANRRLSDAVLASADFRDKRVLDVGCGDGTYTVELYDRAGAASIHGIDGATQAVELARTRVGTRAITFEAGSAESLPMEDDSFDVAHLRGVLHHVDDPKRALGEAMRVAPVVVVTEPNGYNPVLKVLERVSPYHIQHEERSFFPVTLGGWARALGGIVRSPEFVGLVPFFCPDPMARALKLVEPLLERTPLFRQLCCGTYVFVVERRATASR
jgi:SAM-dependent methyltransferase